MKFASALLALAAAERNGKLDDDGIHIGGGAFDAGTPEEVALWSIRKCRKKICAAWSFGRCPINNISELDGNAKVSRAPCCHKCWNKCPPYLARRFLADSSVFQDKEVRRYVKEEVWSFLSEDVQCDLSRLDEFESLQAAEVVEESEAVEVAEGMQMDMGMGGAAAAPNQCGEKFGWFQCHGHRDAHCCSDTCLNQPEKESGKCAKCGCEGQCDFRDNIADTVAKASEMGCYV
ncbi:Oidioi.mRNA.OKI2018_I69.XSR.g13481.t1.cds [Oikopleura dioica]|uniref:Oidioi.mRNA.OKI2018_I69.XSR.g13481.t1.cds n=1 Tax=Oikopleura dioica TaxID=34765 RepID=A0ABN7S708_OIKDI|nr:Oidioi.mRNA.OKI2018_I69.XSR.g13481.t1.cds [Oikopleura dioica]